MAEKRWGDDYRPGMRVRLFDRYHPELGMRDGVIKERSWGRDRGKPIWWFVVVFDGDSNGWVFGPGEIGAGISNAAPKDS